MPLATATITGVSHKLGTSIARPGVVRATYLGGAYIDDDAANTLISGVAEATVQADGSFLARSSRGVCLLVHLHW